MVEKDFDVGMEGTNRVVREDLSKEIMLELRVKK